MIDLNTLILHELSQGLPLVDEPYRELAEKYGLREEDIFQVLEKNKDQGVLKRFGPIAKHRSFGYDQNAMVVFQLPAERIEEVALEIKKFPFITLCYQRRTHKNWPYNLYCMIHGTDRSQVLNQIAEMKEKLQLNAIPSEVLFSQEVFKQTGANYLGGYLEEIDRLFINELQKGISVVERPFEELSYKINWTEEAIVHRLKYLLKTKKLSRFGPMYDVEKFGGVFTLVAMSVPLERFSEVSDFVNTFKEVAHNYEREHKYNMWFVTATETQQQTDIVLKKIEEHTGLRTVSLPKLEEYYLSLRLDI